MGNDPHPLGSHDNEKFGDKIDRIDNLWFLALDLDRDRKVTRIAAFQVTDGTWIDKAFSEPVDRSSVKISSAGYFLHIGQRIYTLSTEAKCWGVLESPPGTTARLFYQENSQWAESNGRLLRWNNATGEWEDVYARTIEAHGRQVASMIVRLQTGRSRIRHRNLAESDFPPRISKKPGCPRSSAVSHTEERADDLRFPGRPDGKCKVRQRDGADPASLRRGDAHRLDGCTAPGSLPHRSR